MQYPPYILTPDGYAGTFAYRTDEGPAYRFPYGIRIVNQTKVKDKMNKFHDLYEKPLKRFGNYEQQPYTVTLTNDEWAGILAIIERSLEAEYGDHWYKIIPTLSDVMDIIRGYKRPGVDTNPKT